MKKIKDDTFTTDDPKIKGKLMQLGYSFTQAVAENNAELAKAICQEVIVTKNKFEEE